MIMMLLNKFEDTEYAREKNLPLDVDYYITKQILPPVERILADFGEHGEKLRVMREKSTQRGQRSLFEF